MSNSLQRLGKGMIYAAWIVVLLLVTLFFNQLLEQQHNPNQDLNTRSYEDGTQEVTLQRNQLGHYVATGHINQQPVVFLLDTGATIVSVPETLSQQLNLEKGTPLLVNTANGTITTYNTQIAEIALGNIKLRNVRGSINPHMQGNEILLGMSFLKKLEFSQVGNTLILRQIGAKL